MLLNPENSIYMYHDKYNLIKKRKIKILFHNIFFTNKNFNKIIFKKNKI